MALTTGKTVEIIFENAVETYEHQDSMLDLVSFNQPDPKKMQNADNVIWQDVQQHAPIISGWDLTGEETGIIEELYPAVLGVPNNDLVQQRADRMRDKQFWEKRAKQSGKRQATELNDDIASAIMNQGSLFYRSDDDSGYDFISNAQVQMNERQLVNNGRSFLLNDRDNRLFGEDLAGRQTLQGRPEQVWSKGQLGQNIAEFNIYTGSFLPLLDGGADPGTAVDGDHSFKPEGGTKHAVTHVVTNIDSRSAEFAVDASGSYTVGDKVTFSNSGTTVKALGLASKIDTGQAMTFTIVSIADSTTIEVFPKPIAADDAALTDLEKAYANVDTTIDDDATVDRINTDESKRSNLFWDKDAIEVIGGTIPAELFSQFDGKKVISTTMKNGLVMYMLYDGDIIELTFRFRLFTWYGITVAQPQNCGVAVTY